MNFHPDKQLFQVARIEPLTLGLQSQCSTSTPWGTHLTGNVLCMHQTEQIKICCNLGNSSQLFLSIESFITIFQNLKHPFSAAACNGVHEEEY